MLERGVWARCGPESRIWVVVAVCTHPRNTTATLYCCIHTHTHAHTTQVTERWCAAELIAAGVPRFLLEEIYSTMGKVGWCVVVLERVCRSDLGVCVCVYVCEWGAHARPLLVGCCCVFVVKQCLVLPPETTCVMLSLTQTVSSHTLSHITG